MEPPPRDSEGVTVPHDHPQIHADNIMLRGIPAQWIRDGGRRISSGAFSPSSDKYKGMSLSAKKIMDCASVSVEQWAWSRFDAVACFPAAVLRNLGVKVGWDPTPDDQAHCNAWGKLTTGARKRLAKDANRRFLPPA